MADFEEDSRQLRQYLVKMYIETWRFARRVERVSIKLNGSDQTRLKSQREWLCMQWEQVLSAAEVGLTVRRLQGEKYDAGRALEIMNADECGEEGVYEIGDVIEPLITDRQGHTINVGKVFLWRAEHE